MNSYQNSRPKTTVSTLTDLAFSAKIMRAANLLRFCALLDLIFLQQSSGQTQKMPAEWDSRQADQFPNPLLNNTKCQVSSPMRICDPNSVLPSETRETSNNLLKSIEGLVILGDPSDKKCLCSRDCPQPTIIMIVALMKCLNKDVHDQWVETKDIAEKFRELWKLHDCSVVLASANDNNRYNLNPGKAVVGFLTSNVTDDINNKVNKTFMDGELASGIAMTVSLYSQALNDSVIKGETTSQCCEVPTPTTGGTIAIVIIIVVLVIVILVITIIIIIKYRKQKQVRMLKDLKEKESSSNKETEMQMLKAEA